MCINSPELSSKQFTIHIVDTSYDNQTQKKIFVTFRFYYLNSHWLTTCLLYELSFFDRNPLKAAH